jgi:hypothetical protein
MFAMGKCFGIFVNLEYKMAKYGNKPKEVGYRNKKEQDRIEKSVERTKTTRNRESERSI